MFGEQALERLAVVRQGPRHGFSVSGHAVLPPHGNSNASHQYVFVNGKPRSWTSLEQLALDTAVTPHTIPGIDAAH